MAHDENPRSEDARPETAQYPDYDEPEPLAGAHRKVHEGLSDADPTGEDGRPLLLTGFIVVIVLALLALLVVGVLINT